MSWPAGRARASWYGALQLQRLNLLRIEKSGAWSSMFAMNKGEIDIHEEYFMYIYFSLNTEHVLHNS